MHSILMYVVNLIVRLALSLRYKVTMKGHEKLTKEFLNKPGGSLFLPNHPCQMDPVIVSTSIWKQFRPRPMMIEYMYYTPGVHWLAKQVKALPIPNFELAMNSFKRKQNDAVFDQAVEAIRKGDNFLLYPGGRLKHTGKEIIGGASGVHRILDEARDINVVLVRSTGLWGSRFSRALIGESPPLGKTMWSAFKDLLKNLVFFMPRRRVTLEFVVNPSDFPWGGSRAEVNAYLEKFYNSTDESGEEKGEPLVLVSNAFWKEEYPEVYTEKSQYEDVVDISKVPASIKDAVIEELARMTHVQPGEIKIDQHLSMDLGIDSLDAADLVVWLEDHFDVEGILPGNLTTVSRVISIAGKQEVVENEEMDEAPAKEWFRPEDRPNTKILGGKTIGEAFLRQCDRMGNSIACVDHSSKTLTYRQMKMRALLLADQFKKFKGDNVGILLPSTTASTICIFACHLAKKTPVMINWTVGPRHLSTVVEVTGINEVLTSWKFLDRLDGVDLTGVDDKLIMLEDMARDLTIWDKAKTLACSFRKAKSLVSSLDLNSVSEDSAAVMLFTSGTEGSPKGVPLSHKNILYNQRSTLDELEFASTDILYGMLPPFHSFGFSVTGILPVLAGMRVVYYPNPTDSVALAKGVEKWGVTLLCSAPTFLNAILKSGKPEQFNSVRYFLCGAEAPPPELREHIVSLGGNRLLLEGYGITECAPILSFTPPDEEKVGVGRPIPGVEMRIVNPDTHEVLPQGERGLILAHGPNVFPGYANKGASEPFVQLEGKRWYSTGDLGFFDEVGNLTLAGRLKRFIKVGGEMISLRAIEEALLNAAPKFDWKRPEGAEGPMLAICAEELPGEKAKIYLFCTFATTVEEANRALRGEGFSNLVKISHARQLEEIPVMGTGKIFYRRLEQWYVHGAEE